MSKNIISAENSVFKNCYSGTDFEDNVVEFLQHLHFKANRIRKNDGGVDIIASICIQNTDYKFFIQCKYYNRTLTKTPVQEVFAGSHYYDNAGYPVVITNNRMTYEARRYAKKLGVEVIADIEWEEIRAAYKTKIINSPYQRKGLLGMILAYFGNDQAYFQAAVSREDINYETEVNKPARIHLNTFRKATDHPLLFLYRIYPKFVIVCTKMHTTHVHRE